MNDPKKIADLLDRPSRWFKNTAPGTTMCHAVDANNTGVACMDPTAVKWTLFGAILKLYNKNNNEAYTRLIAAMTPSQRRNFNTLGGNLGHFNNNRDTLYSDIIALARDAGV